MAKPIKANLKMKLKGGQASAAPPVGSILGQYGVNMMDFVTPFNEKTKDLMGKNLTVHIIVYEDKTMDWRVVGVPTDDLIREALKIEKGSGKPNTAKIGSITKAQVKQIAEKKMPDLNAGSIEAAMKIVEGSARSMGVDIK